MPIAVVITAVTARPAPLVASDRHWGHSRRPRSIRSLVARLSPRGPGLAALLVLLTLLAVPEEPRAQEAICQRHSGVAGCRVW